MVSTLNSVLSIRKCYCELHNYHRVLKNAQVSKKYPQSSFVHIIFVSSGKGRAKWKMRLCTRIHYFYVDIIFSYASTTLCEKTCQKLPLSLFPALPVGMKNAR